MRQDADRRPVAYWAGLMHAFGPGFAERADRCDANDTFVAENFAELKERGVLAAGVPAELGGGGASYPELCEMLRILGAVMWFDRADTVHAHAPSCDPRLALAE